MIRLFFITFLAMASDLNLDKEIINNLEFFQNMDVIKNQETLIFNDLKNVETVESIKIKDDQEKVK